MTAPYVARKIKELVDGVNGATFVETVNIRPPSVPSVLWVTLENDYSKVERVTLGEVDARFRETGTVTLVVMVRAGSDTVLANATAEAMRNTLWGFVDGYLSIDVVESPVDHPPDDGNFFEVRVAVPYLYDFIR